MSKEFIVSNSNAAESGVPLADAQAATAVPDDAYNVSAEKMMMDNLMILGLLFFVFYYMLIRPQQQRVKAHKKMLGELAKGKKVMTAGGIIGTIIKFEGDDIVVVEIAPEVKVRVSRSSITDMLDASTAGTANDN